MQGDPRSQRSICSTLQARRARPSSLEGEPVERGCDIAGDPQSQRPVCSTLDKQVPLSRGTAEELATMQGDPRRQRPAASLQHPPSSQARPSSLEGEPEEQERRHRNAATMQGDPRSQRLFLQHPPGSLSSPDLPRRSRSFSTVRREKSWYSVHLRFRGCHCKMARKRANGGRRTARCRQF